MVTLGTAGAIGQIAGCGLGCLAMPIVFLMGMLKIVVQLPFQLLELVLVILLPKKKRRSHRR